MKTKKENRIYLFSAVISAVLLIFHVGLYKLSSVLVQKIALISAYTPKIDFIDNSIPLVPAFVYIYISAYVYWFVCPILNSSASRKKYSDYIIAFAISYFVGFVFLSLFPTIMIRAVEGLPPAANDISSRILGWFVMNLDGGEIARSLLPSFHCLTSACCYLGVHGAKEVPKKIRIFIFIYSLLIILSTLFVKQHYFLDAVAGILISVICFLITEKFHLGKVIEPILSKYDHQ